MDEMTNQIYGDEGDELVALREEVEMWKNAASEWRSDLAGSVERENTLRNEVERLKTEKNDMSLGYFAISQNQQITENQLRSEVERLNTELNEQIQWVKDLADDLIESESEIARLKEKCDKQAMILRRLFPDKSPNTWFACGELGPKDQNGLPQKIEICPAYGVDWTVIYEKTDKIIGGMGS